MPDNLLQPPCGAIKSGDTLRSLAKGYVKNTGCVFDYQLLLKKQREWNTQQGKLYDTTK